MVYEENQWALSMTCGSMLQVILRFFEAARLVLDAFAQKWAGDAQRNMQNDFVPMCRIESGWIGKMYNKRGYGYMQRTRNQACLWSSPSRRNQLASKMRLIVVYGSVPKWSESSGWWNNQRHPDADVHPTIPEIQIYHGRFYRIPTYIQSHPESWHQIPSLFLTSGDLMILLSFIGQGVVHDDSLMLVYWAGGSSLAVGIFWDMAHGLENLTKHLPLQLTTTTGIRNTTLQPCHSTTTQLVLVQQNPKKKILKLQKSPKSTFLFPKDLPFSIILPH